MVLPMPRRHEVGVAERPARDVIAAFEEDELGAVSVRGWPHDGSLVPRRCWRRRIGRLLRHEQTWRRRQDENDRHDPSHETNLLSVYVVILMTAVSPNRSGKTIRFLPSNFTR